MKTSRLINYFLSFFGIRIQRIPRRLLFNLYQPSINSEEIMLSGEFNIDTIIDVGVAKGTEWLYNPYNNAKLILIEPLNVYTKLNDIIKDRTFEIFECALGSKNGFTDIYFDKTEPSKSSIYKREKLTKTEDHEIELRRVELKKLDQIVASSKLSPQSIGLKIDTEGHELEVLKGATKTLGMCEFVICEISIERRFINSYDFSELIVFMNNKNFKLTKILRFAKDKNGVIRFADVLFEKKVLRLSKNKER